MKCKWIKIPHWLLGQLQKKQYFICPLQQIRIPCVLWLPVNVCFMVWQLKEWTAYYLYALCCQSSQVSLTLVQTKPTNTELEYTVLRTDFRWHLYSINRGISTVLIPAVSNKVPDFIVQERKPIILTSTFLCYHALQLCDIFIISPQTSYLLIPFYLLSGGACLSFVGLMIPVPSLSI